MACSATPAEGRPAWTILVADDDPALLKIASIQLSAAGYQVLTARDGVEAVRATIQHRPDLILLDITMPGMDGFQVCRFLKNYPPCDRIPIVFLTVHSGIGARQRGIFRGGADYLCKPLDMKELETKIKEMLLGSEATPGQHSVGESGTWAGEMNGLAATSKLGEILDESLYSLSIMEEVSRAVAAASDEPDIIKKLLVGCMSHVGLGFDRMVFLAASDDGRRLVGRMALGQFPEAGVGPERWMESVGRLGRMTLREIYDGALDSFPFIWGDRTPLIGGLVLGIPNGDRVYDLSTLPEGADVWAMMESITAEAAERLGSRKVQAIPVVGKQGLVGTLVVDNNKTRRRVTVEDATHLLILCNQVGLALERCRLLEQQAEWTAQLEHLSMLNRSVIDEAGVGIVFLDPNGRIIIWNRMMEVLSGRKDYRVADRFFFDVFPGLARSLLASRLKQVYETHVMERVGHYRMSLGKRDGYYDVKMNPVIVRGDLQGVVVLIEDISRRVMLENKSREMYQYLSSIIHCSADAIVTTDPKGRIRTQNPQAEKMFGHSEASVKGRSVGVLFPPERKQEKAMVLKRVAAGETVRDLETSLISASGERMFVSLTASPVLHEDGSLQTACLFIRDITERKRLISQLVQTEKLASLGVMSAGMAHEINNPLASIVMHAQLLEMTQKLSPESREYLGKITEETDRISEIVNDLLVYSRTRDKQRELMDIGVVLDRAVTFIQRKTAAGGVDVKLSCRKRLPAVEAVPNELLEIFLNILLNAADALGPGGTIAVRAEQGAPPGGEGRNWVRVRVADTGHGIPPADLSKIFDPFFTTKPPGRGTGLGLMVVNRLVEGYGGRIEVESVKGRGTTFTIYLPAAGAAAGARATGEEAC